MFERELIHNFLSELSKIEDSSQVITSLLKEYIKSNPDELAVINLVIGQLSAIALDKKKEELITAANSMQYLMSLNSVGTKLKKTTPEIRIVSFIGTMITLFPTGEKLGASSIESEFYDNFIRDLREWDQYIEWAKRYGYFEYLSNLLKLNEIT